MASQPLTGRIEELDRIRGRMFAFGAHRGFETVRRARCQPLTPLTPLGSGPLLD